MIVEYNKLKEMTYKLLMSGGMNEENANILAEILVTAEARGVYSHGIQMTPTYVRLMEEGVVTANPEIKIVEESDSALVIDGDHGLGGIVMSKALDLLVAKSKKTGAATLAVRNSGHYGAGAYYVEKAAEMGQAAFLYANTSKSAVPFGGTGRYLGTNPYSFSVPAGKYGTVTLDMATTETAAGKLGTAAREGRQVPLGCGVDKDGNPTTDPVAITQGGALCHFGGVKGYGIAFMINVMAGVLTGAEYKPDELDLFGRTKEHPTVGFYMNITDIAHFMPMETFIERIEDSISDIKSVKPAPGFAEVCYPGEIENKKKIQAMTEGVNVHDVAYGTFIETLKNRGIEF